VVKTNRAIEGNNLKNSIGNEWEIFNEDVLSDYSSITIIDNNLWYSTKQLLITTQ